MLQRRLVGLSLLSGKYEGNVVKVIGEEYVPFENIHNFITEHTYSLIIFKNQYRSQVNFLSSSMVALDIDGGLTLDTAMIRLKSLNLKCIVGTTRNHQKVKGKKPACDRYRIIVELSRDVTNLDDYRQTIKSLRGMFPESDPSPKDGARLFFRCNEIVFEQYGGALLAPGVAEPQFINKPGKPILSDSDEYTVARIKNMLLAQPGAVQGENGDAATLQIANRVFDFGVSTADVCCFLLEQYWNERCSPPWEHEELLKKCQNALTYRQNPVGNLAPENVFGEEIVIEPMGDIATAKDVLETDWQNTLKKANARADSPPKNSLENTVIVLKNAVSPQIFRHNLFAYRDAYGIDTPWGGKKDDAVTDADLSKIMHWIGVRHRFEPKKLTVNDAINVIAHENAFHPVRDMLEALPEWDGVGRLDTWLKDHFGAEGNPEYLAQVFRKWMVAAITRVYRPGTKFDWIIIFEGAQGVGKSSFGERLVGSKFFLDWLPNLADKDAAQGLQGIWGVELAELSSLRKVELEIVKGYITRTVDKYRPSHGHRTIEAPRQCVFYGTTNREEYLRDDTGNRRFKPVKVGMLDFEALTRDRDQLWAEALFIFNERLEPSLYLEGEARECETEIQKSKMVKTEADIYSDEIRVFFENETDLEIGENMVRKIIDKNKFTVRELFGDGGPLAKWRLDARNVQFVTQALKKLGAEAFRTHKDRFWRLNLAKTRQG